MMMMMMILLLLLLLLLPVGEMIRDMDKVAGTVCGIFSSPGKPFSRFSRPRTHSFSRQVPDLHHHRTTVPGRQSYAISLITNQGIEYT
jgi:hypothetical protein